MTARFLQEAVAQRGTARGGAAKATLCDVNNTPGATVLVRAHCVCFTAGKKENRENE